MTEPLASMTAAESISTTTAVSTAAVTAAVSAHDESDITAAIARYCSRLAIRPAADGEQPGNGGTRDEDNSDPEEYLAQVSAPSLFDSSQGNQR